ncbi:MAG: hypothetical protein D3918_00610 [Candidatus Electrothrix sp. AX2]|nr:hypothetical protein [Candidatus Electrothrix gigas]
MVFKKKSYLCIALTVFLGTTEDVLAKEDAKQDIISSIYNESAVSSLLLAAGMYGGMNKESSQKINLSLGQSTDMMKGLFTHQGKFEGHDITLSYEGSVGRLGFSAGYIYTTEDTESNRGSLFLGLENYSKNTLNNIEERPWYLTVGLSHSFQLNNEFAIGIGSKAVLFTNTPDDENIANKAVAMSLNLPVSYKGFITITPEFQWSRSLHANGEQDTRNDIDNFLNPEDGQNAFYGGMSISFSY